MVGVISVGAIGSRDILGLGPSDDTSCGRIHDLVFTYPGLIHIVARSRI